MQLLTVVSPYHSILVDHKLEYESNKWHEIWHCSSSIAAYCGVSNHIYGWRGWIKSWVSPRLICSTTTKKTLLLGWIWKNYNNNVLEQYVFIYCGWLGSLGSNFFVVFVKSQIHEFQYPWSGNFVYELWKKILWPRNLNPTNVSFLFNPRKFVSRKIKPSTVYTIIWLK